MRCFVAVDLDSNLRQKVADLQKDLTGLDTKLVEPENLHFTLKFLGEADEGIVNEVKQILKETARTQEPFSVNISGIGAFPSEKFIRVVWIGGPEIYNLQTFVNNTLAGLFREEKPDQKDASQIRRSRQPMRQSVIHLTIARVRSQTHKDDIVGFINRHRNIEIGTMLVKDMKLKKSTITGKGPVYEDIEIFRLGT